MTAFFTALHLLNLKHYEFTHTMDVDCIKFSNKYNCPLNYKHYYASVKADYFLSKCTKCKALWWLKKRIKYFDKLLKNHKCHFVSWELKQPLSLFFSNGSVVNIEFNTENNTILKIDIDDSLCSKILPYRVVDAILCDSYIFVTYNEPKLTVINIKENSSLLSKIFGRNKGKSVSFEPKVFNYDIFAHNTKCYERKLSVNIHNDLLMVWWKNSGDDVWPWTPISYATDKINILIYSINEGFIELLCSVKVQNELLHASFSNQNANKIFALEETKREAEVTLNISVYELSNEQCQLCFSTKLPVTGSLISFNWSTDDKLLAADMHGLLFIYDVSRNSSLVTNLEVLPKYVSWHPQNSVILIASQNNQILCFDTALNPINFKLCYKSVTDINVLELNSYFQPQFSIQKILWQKSAYNDTCLLLLNSDLITLFLFIKFSFGFTTRFQLTEQEIISQYLKCNKLDPAILLLRSLDWCYKSEIKFQCISKIANFLLRRPLNFETQAALELVLGTYYDWVEHLPKRVIDTYGHKMHHLARRFFHHLLRYHKFRKAFLLAVDLESQDLFMDLYHVAKQKGENVLAAVSLRKVEEFDELSGSSSESCLSDSNSESVISIPENVNYGNSPHMISREKLYVPPISFRKSNENENTLTSQSMTRTYQSHSNYSPHEFNNGSDLPAYCTRFDALLHHGSISNCVTQDYIFPNHLKHSIPSSNPEINSHKNHIYMPNNSSYIIKSNNDSCDMYNSASGIKNTKDRYTIDEDNEEVEGTQIKLAHMGII